MVVQSAFNNMWKAVLLFSSFHSVLTQYGEEKVLSYKFELFDVVNGTALDLIEACEERAKQLHVRGYLVEFEERQSVVGLFESDNNDTVTYMLDWLMSKAGPNCTLETIREGLYDDYLIQNFVSYSRRGPYSEFAKSVSFEVLYSTDRFKSLEELI